MDITFSDADPLDAETPLLALVLFQDEEELPGPARAFDQRTGGQLTRARAAGDFRAREGQELLFYLPEEGGAWKKGKPGEEGAAGEEGRAGKKGGHGEEGRPGEEGRTGDEGRTGEEGAAGEEGRAGKKGGPGRILVLGAGPAAEADRETLRRAAGRAVRRAESLSLTEVSVLSPALKGVEPGERVQALAEGLGLAAWDFRELRAEPSASEESPPAPLLTAGKVLGEGEQAALARAVEVGRAFAEGQNLARTLQSRPGNVATPTHLAEVALEMADAHGMQATILGPRELEEERMGALLSVARGSDQEPRLIVLEHRRGEEGAAPLALVGKGLTFDSGGISIKPAQGMEDMKYDMSGGAAVLGAMQAIAALGLPVNVVGVVPASENLINGSANKPGDVVRTRAGKTVEVINTDAEGRLILADALAYTLDRFQPAAVVDCATLTGACVVALGHHAAAVLGTDESLVEELRAAGERAGERCWPLPLWKPYRKQLESPVADLKNVGGRPAGTITAGWFLSEFTGAAPWAHLDIAGTAYGETDVPYRRKGAFGFPTRLLLEWVRARAG